MAVAVQTMPVSSLLDRSPSVPTVASSVSASDDVKESRHAFPRRLPTPSSSRVYVPKSDASTKQRVSRPSFYASMRASGLTTICAKPHVLASLLSHLSWADFQSMSGASRSLRRVFLDSSMKDLVFARFVPGYRTALRLRDKRMWQDSIRMNYADLGQLVASLDTPLHRYPMHAMSVLSSDFPSLEQTEFTLYLQQLNRVHSRAVLFLQNMVHSSSQLLISDLDEPRVKTSNSPQSGLRELTFPAPLSYFDSSHSKSLDKASRHSLSAPVTDDTASLPAVTDKKSTLHTTRSRHSRKWGSESAADGLSTNKFARRASRLSIFGGNANRPPLPPPASEPESMRLYSGSWRRTRSNFASLPEDEGILRPPNRRFLVSRYSSDSSLGSSPTPPSVQQSSTPSSSSPLDLLAAVSRTRAPVLRVFVPCSRLTEDVIAACEDQLIDEGLWEHLSAGDIVCNFGYVPPLEETEEESSRNPGSDNRRWLIYTGEQLVIYYPTDPTPIPDALSLPSPFYYTHILPPFTNPHFRLTLPPFKAHYTLTNLTTTIQSPHSGYTRVNTYAWLASLDAHSHSAMSDGWRGEWVLQGEGTREGKVALQNALRGGQSGEHEYEIVIEKSGNGRLWLRMLSSPSNQQPLSPDTLDSSEPLDLRTP